jgi:putative endonuclease
MKPLFLPKLNRTPAAVVAPTRPTTAAPRTEREVVGADGEARAVTLLEKSGLRIVDRNFRSRFGEIDIIAIDGDCLVFVEVRVRREGRTRGRFGGAVASVDWRKQQKIIQTAEQYLFNRPGPAPRCRFDVVAMDGEGTADWIQNAFIVES